MPRVLLLAAIVGIFLYALLDWIFNSKRGTPGGLSRWIWLSVILFLPFLGPLTWVVMRLVSAAESRMAQNEGPTPPPQTAPDDDATFLDGISRKIERRQKKAQPRSTSLPPALPEERDPEEANPGDSDDESPPGPSNAH